MSNFLNKIPVSPITSFGNPSVPNGSTFGTNFSILQTGGYMEVYTLSGLTYTIPPATTGIIEFSGNSIPIQFTKGSGSVFSPDVLTLNSDNISSGRRKLGMLAYVYETNKIYQFRIDNYDTLWGNATGATGPGGPTVVISDFGTTVKNNSVAGQSFINAWTASTISGVGGYDDTNASWRVLSTGGSGGGASITGGTFDNNTDTLTLNNSTGGTITITGFTDIFVTGGTYSDGTTTFTNNTGGTFTVSGYFTGQTDNSITGGTFDKNSETLSLNNSTGGTITITGFTDVFVTGGTYSGGTIIFTNNSGGTFNVEGLFTGATDVFVTGGTYSAGTTTFTNNTGGTFQVTGYTKQGDYVESVTGDGVDNTDPVNPVVNQNNLIHIETVTLGTLGLTGFGDDSIMYPIYQNYLNTLNYQIDYETLFELHVIEGTGTTWSTSFVCTFQVNSPNETITLPYSNTGTYSGVIDWGDGTPVVNSYANRSHTYLTPGLYTVTITGTIYKFNFYNSGSWANIREIKQWGNINLGNDGNYFRDCNYLNLNNVIDVPNLSGTTYLQGMFQNCSSLTTINNIGDWDVSNVILMVAMFAGTQFNQPLSGWNVSNVTNMAGMFNNSQFNQPIGNWNVSNVQFMSSMFAYTQFNQPLSGWNVSNVTNMTGMFSNSQFNQPIGNWDVSKVNRMDNMFYNSPFNQPLSGWNVSSVTNMNSMFLGNTVFNQPIGNWNVSGVTDMGGMFFNSQFNQPIGNWNVSGVTNMNGMFYNNVYFNQPLSGWNVSNVTSMSQMFSFSQFNQSLSNWNVSKVNDMSYMFWGNIPFNQNIGNWNISGVTNFFLFMQGKTSLTFSTTNLNSIYNGWSTKNPKPNLNISFGSANYTISGGQAARNILTGTYGWTITDGGGI